MGVQPFYLFTFQPQDMASSLTAEDAVRRHIGTQGFSHEHTPALVYKHLESMHKVDHINTFT